MLQLQLTDFVVSKQKITLKYVTFKNQNRPKTNHRKFHLYSEMKHYLHLVFLGNQSG